MSEQTASPTEDERTQQDVAAERDHWRKVAGAMKAHAASALRNGVVPADALWGTVEMLPQPTDADLPGVDPSDPMPDPLRVPLTTYAAGLDMVAQQEGAGSTTAALLRAAARLVRDAAEGRAAWADEFARAVGMGPTEDERTTAERWARAHYTNTRRTLVVSIPWEEIPESVREAEIAAMLPLVREARAAEGAVREALRALWDDACRVYGPERRPSLNLSSYVVGMVTDALRRGGESEPTAEQASRAPDPDRVQAVTAALLQHGANRVDAPHFARVAVEAMGGPVTEDERTQAERWARAYHPAIVRVHGPHAWDDLWDEARADLTTAMLPLVREARREQASAHAEIERLTKQGSALYGGLCEASATVERLTREREELLTEARESTNTIGELRGEQASRPAPLPPSTLDRERLGRLVREVWIAWAREQPNPKDSWLVPWEGLAESDKEVDRRIGERLAEEGRAAEASDCAHLVSEAWDSVSSGDDAGEVIGGLHAAIKARIEIAGPRLSATPSPLTEAEARQWETSILAKELDGNTTAIRDALYSLSRGEIPADVRPSKPALTAAAPQQTLTREDAWAALVAFGHHEHMAESFLADPRHHLRANTYLRPGTEDILRAYVAHLDAQPSEPTLTTAEQDLVVAAIPLQAGFTRDGLRVIAPSLSTSIARLTREWTPRHAIDALAAIKRRLVALEGAPTSHARPKVGAWHYDGASGVRKRYDAHGYPTCEVYRGAHQDRGVGYYQRPYLPPVMVDEPSVPDAMAACDRGLATWAGIEGPAHVDALTPEQRAALEAQSEQAERDALGEIG